MGPVPGGTSRFASDKLQMVAQRRVERVDRFAGAQKQSVKCILNTNVIYPELRTKNREIKPYVPHLLLSPVRFLMD